MLRTSQDGEPLVPVDYEEITMRDFIAKVRKESPHIALDSTLELTDCVQVLLERISKLEIALVQCLIPLESIHASVEWELCDVLKQSIAEAVQAGREVVRELVDQQSA